MRGRARAQRWFGRLPRWVRGVAGGLAVVLGVVVLPRPTTSLALLALLLGAGMVVTGALELLGAAGRDGERSVWRWLAAALWLGGGALVLVWPDLTVRALAGVVAGALLVNGVLSLGSAARRGATPDARVSAALLGLAGVAAGLLALLWPDITLLVVAVVLGARLVLAGVLVLWHAVRGTSGTAGASPDHPTRLARWTRTSAAVVALALAVGAGVVSATLRDGSPVVDDFYAAPRDVPDEPGRLVRAEPFTRAVPDDARAWRILYTTTTADGSPAVASGLVVVPTSGDGDHPVVDWAHGTTGVAQQCAPSLLAEPFESGALFLLPHVLERGWALVATDYVGLGTPGPHAYLVGVPSAHAVLDARRAAAELDEARLGDETVVWGHSQGGGAALWTGAVADDYAPDVPLAGVAALAPAANLPGLVDGLPEVTGGSIFASFVITAYAAAYEDVSHRRYVRPGAEVTVRRLATRCLGEPAVLASALVLLGLARDPDVVAQSPTTGPLGARLAENVPPATSTAPLLVGQGADDTLVVPAAQDAYVGTLCDAGMRVVHRTYAGEDHLSLVAPDSPLVPQLLEWTAARFAGEPVATGCARTAH